MLELIVDYATGFVRLARPRQLLDLELVTAPQGAIADLDGLKAQLGITFDTDDTLISNFELGISGSLDAYSGTLGRALLTQTWRLNLDHFPLSHAAIRLPLPPLQSVSSLTYLDGEGVEQTLDPSLYVVLAGGRAEIVPAFGCLWPRALRQPRAVTIEFVCGYGDAAAVPNPIKTAIAMYVASLYENRESTVIGPRAQVIENPVAELLLKPFRLVGV